MGAFGPKLFKKSLASYILGIVVYHFILHAMHLGLIEFESLKFGGTPFIQEFIIVLYFYLQFLFLLIGKKNGVLNTELQSLLIISLLVNLIIIEGRSGQILFAIIIPFWVLHETRKWIYFWGTVLGIFITLCILFTSLHSFQKRYVQIQEQWDRFQKGIYIAQWDKDFII